MLVRQRRHVERSAFTLMEIIVVVAIILILAGAGIVVYQNMLVDARANRARMDVKNLEQAVVTVYVQKGVYPATLEELTEPDANGKLAILNVSALKDPWDQLYQYESTNLHPKTGRPRIFTQGEPGKGPFIDNWADPNMGGG